MGMKRMLLILTIQSFTRGLKLVNRIFLYVFLPLFLCPLVALPAVGRRERNNTAVQEENIVELQSRSVQSAVTEGVAVQVSGRVRLVGTTLFPELVITGPDTEWYVDRDEMFKLADLQHRMVTIEGTETVAQLFWANGRPAGERRILKDINIIDVE
jgi:hypothetical protein